MVNATNILENNYNLTKIFNNQPITDPTQWLGAFNELMKGYYVVSLLAVVGISLFFLIREKNLTSDSEAGLYAGLICSISGLFLFLADVITGNTLKLLTWEQLVPFFLITGACALIDHVRRKY